MTTVLEVGECSASRPGRSLPPGKTRYPLYSRLSGPQGRSGKAENIAAPGFDPRTVQLVVSRYTDWVIWPTTWQQNSALLFIYLFIYLFIACDWMNKRKWEERRKYLPRFHNTCNNVNYNVPILIGVTSLFNTVRPFYITQQIFSSQRL